MILEYVNRLYTRMLLMVARGVIQVVNDSQGIQLVQVQLGSNETRDNTLRMQEYGLTSNPPSGTRGIVLFVGGDRTNGVMIATDNPDLRAKGLAVGEVKLYDNASKFIYLAEDGIHIGCAGLPLFIDSPITQSTGDIIDNSGTNGHTMAQMRSIYNTHTHGGVLPGTDDTAIPNQPE